MFNKQDIFIFRAAMTINAMLIFINTTSANVYTPSGRFEILIASKDIIAMSEIKTFTRNNRFYDIGVMDIVKYILTSLVFSVCPHKDIRVIDSNSFPHFSIFNTEKIAAGMDSNNLNFISFNLRVNRFFAIVHIITRYYCSDSKTVFNRLISKVAGHCIAASTATRTRSTYRHCLAIDIDAKIDISWQCGKVKHAFSDLAITVYQ